MHKCDKTLQLAPAEATQRRLEAPKHTAFASSKPFARSKHGAFRAIFDNALDPMIIFDDRSRILDANLAACSMVGANKKDLKGNPVESIFPFNRKGATGNVRAGLMKQEDQRGECMVRPPDGPNRTFEFYVKANYIPGRHLAVLRDVTERKRAEESLRLLSRRLMRLQDDERRRIARELHDSTGQCLTALRMNLDAVCGEDAALGAESRKALRDARQLIDQCATDLRTLSYLLHPPLLDEAGLAAALRWCVDGFAERSGIRTTLEISNPLDGLPSDLSTAIYRIVQESLANVHRHSGSLIARVRLFMKDGQLTLQVQDEGRGIPKEIIHHGSGGIQNLGVGLAGMRERVNQLGGDLQIFPAHPGTLVNATFPLEANDDKASIADRG